MKLLQWLLDHRAAILRIISALMASIGGYQVTQLAGGDAPMSAGNVAAPMGWFATSVLPLVMSFLTGPIGQGGFEKAMAKIFAFIRSKGPVDPTIRVVAVLNVGNAAIELSHDNPAAQALAQQWKALLTKSIVDGTGPLVVEAAAKAVEVSAS